MDFVIIWLQEYLSWSTPIEIFGFSFKPLILDSENSHLKKWTAEVLVSSSLSKSSSAIGNTGALAPSLIQIFLSTPFSSLSFSLLSSKLSIQAPDSLNQNLSKHFSFSNSSGGYYSSELFPAFSSDLIGSLLTLSVY